MASTASLSSGRGGGLLPLGAQRPRICHVPEFVTSAGPEAMEVAGLVGIVPDDWQEFTLTGALGERADGSWSAPTVGLVVARQNGKGTDLEIRELHGLFVLGESINHTAHQQKTATNHFERLLRLIESCPDFDRQVLRAPKGKGLEAIHLRGGNVIFFATRAGGAGRGLTFDLLVYDEAMYLSEQDRSSLAPTMSARSMGGEIQTWYVGSAVDQQDPAQDGVPFAQVREQGIAGADGVAYFEFSAPGDNPSDVPADVLADTEMWALANPALGKRISHDWVERERTVEMSSRSFAVERLSIGDWPDTSDAGKRVIAADVWDALEDRQSTALDPVCFAFDVSPDRSMASIAAAGRREDGKVHVEVVERRRGTGWVVGRAEELLASHPNSGLICDGAGPAGSLLPEFRDEPRTVTAGEHARACGMFFDAATPEEDNLRHLGTRELSNALAGARKRSLGDAWAWSRKSSSVDISPLVACTLAYWGVATTEVYAGPLLEVFG